METYDDDDDTHFCIKCHATISGLENYVRHRQQAACFRVTDKEGIGQEATAHATTTNTSSYPEILNADAFFNSLELRSSTKKPSRGLDRVKQERWRGGKDDKQVGRKRSRKSQSAPDEEIAAKVSSVPEKMTILPVDADFDNPTDHLGLPSLVGFPDIVASTGSKSGSLPAAGSSGKSSVTPLPMKALEASAYDAKQEPPLENSLEPFMAEDTSPKSAVTKRREVWLGDTVLVGLGSGGARDKREDSSALYVEYDYAEDEESDDDTIDDGLAAADEDEDDSGSATDDADPEYPPHGHTGGKWRPGLTAIEASRVPDDDLLPEDEGEPDEDSPERPPPSHTGGKWKPPTDIAHHQKMELDEEDEQRETKDESSASRQPPPGHTKGKWVPGAGNEQNNRGFYCTPCGRRLASRLVYNRHLLTELHAKRSIRELDGSLRPPREVQTSLRKRKERSTRRRRSSTWKIRETEETEASGENQNKHTRKRRREILWCEMCRTKVRRAQMGKHLLSHYHCRVAGVIPSGPKARSFLLDNMANVVRQCPFQCASCRFYCNTEDTFLLHWRSELHATTQSRISGSYRCTACDFWCEENETMESHLTSDNHREAVFVMNGSVPVVVRRQRHLPCDTCGQSFRYNLQLRQHSTSTGHGATTASDEYQVRLSCSSCHEVFRSLVALQRHYLTSHANDQPGTSSASQEPYFCSFCSLNFSSSKDAILHRRTSQHKEIVRAARKNAEGRSISRQCPHCDATLTSLSQLKQHLLRIHPELCHRCPRCADTFALPQDLARHTKAGECFLKEPERVASEDEAETWNCRQCSYATNSQAEFIYHEALHVGCSVEVHDSQPSGEHDDEVLHKFQCPVCHKLFKKQNYLLKHIRIHTGERPFPCPSCKTSFATRTKLNAHIPRCSAASPSWMDVSGRHRNYVCSECNDAFYTNHALQQHTLRHTGKKFRCPIAGCPTALRTAAELRTHRDRVHRVADMEDVQRCTECRYVAPTAIQLRRHRRQEHRPEHRQEASSEDAKGFACPYTDCHFRTKLRSHLRRHLRLHTGAKPYKCRHCPYASNNFENLRKHVLSTKRHPGKTVYECTFCSRFSTNFSRDLRAHLLEVHPDSFPTTELAANHVANIYGTDIPSRGETSSLS